MIGKHHFFNHLQITMIITPNGLLQFTMKATKTDIPELLQSQFVAVPAYDFSLGPQLKNMVPGVSRSVLARLTVIDGLLPVIEGLLGVGSRSVHGRLTLAILGP